MKEVSARANVLPYLVQLGIVDDEGRTVDRARQWRDDTQYPDVCREMREDVYPRELLDAVPNPSENREAAARWFANSTGKGRAAVDKMVSVYSLLMDGNVSGQPAARPKAERPKKRDISSTKQTRASKSESPQMRVGSGGASSMPPQQRNSIEINAPGEWKP